MNLTRINEEKLQLRAMYEILQEIQNNEIQFADIPERGLLQQKYMQRYVDLKADFIRQSVEGFEIQVEAPAIDRYAVIGKKVREVY